MTEINKEWKFNGTEIQLAKEQFKCPKFRHLRKLSQKFIQIFSIFDIFK